MHKSVVQSCLSPSWGGLEMVAFETAQILKENNIYCTTMALTDSPLARRLKEDQLPCIEVGKKRNLFKCAFLSRELLKTTKATTIFVQQLKDLSFLRLALIGNSTTELVGFSHTFVGVNKKDPYHKWLYGRVNHLVALTKSHKENLLQWVAIEAEKFVLIPNSVDSEVFHPAKRSESIRKDFDSTGEKILLGLVGRIDKQKGQGLVVEATGILKAQGYSNFKMVFVGEETLHEPGITEKLKTRAQELGVSELIHFAGFRRDVPEVMASLDMMIMASDAETFGRVIIESMSCGTPVAATQAGGVVDIITQNQDGLFFQPKDPQSLATALIPILDKPEKRIQLGQNGRKTVLNNFCRKITVPKILGLIK